MIVGIDLGTTNSLVGIWSADGPKLIPNSLQSTLTPSVISVDETGTLLVGAAARERLITHPALSVATFKRYMGSERVTNLGTHSFRPEDLSALVLRSLITDAELHTGEKVTEAIISVPAYFSDAQRKATRNAGQLCGIKVERLINEPTAAALAYGLQQDRSEAHFLVFDLGGGTFDVSILEMYEGVMEVHASAGDNFLGGEDFVELLCQAMLSDLKLRPEQITCAQTAQLRSRMERLKCQLSQSQETELTIHLAGQDRHWSISETRFESLAAPLLQRIRTPVERALRDAKKDPNELDAIVLVGGASRMPMISRMVTRMFGRLPLRHLNPDEVVARGTCVMTGMKNRDEAFREIVMTDVCPYTLGIEVSRTDERKRVHNGLFSPIIERNTVIPASREKRYVPTTDYQKQLLLRIYQGEAPRVSNNVYLGQLSVPLPPKRAEETPVDVRFTYDVNGLLEVEAIAVATSERHQLLIEQNPGLLTPEQILQRLAVLAEIKIHPREHQANLAVMQRAERLFEERTGDERLRLGEWIHAFASELETQDIARIERFRGDMSRFLDSVDAPLLP